ncbi:MAG: FliA/WhiG family RNA polymerase sigma factor [Bdellovibrionales bacterium]|nr:FliA/WhiG family RNA polymerase sigma factor [Bdellovibrionales bacterium]
MALNPGIQKYRESAKLSKAKASEKASSAKPEAKKAKSTTEKNIEKTLKAAKAKTAAEAAKIEKSAKAKTAAAKAVVAKTGAKAPVAAKAAATKTAAAKGKTAGKVAANGDEDESLLETTAEGEEGEVIEEEEQELQAELEAEIARDAVQTSSLVKEDYSPTNSTRDRLVVEYAPLIKYIAQKIAARLPTNIELDDLISSGVIGLMDAIEKYDASRDNKFKTYAEFRIRGAILDELRAQDWVPRSVREKAKALERCYVRIEQQKGRQATDEEVCADLGISQDEYHDMLNQVRSVSLLSFDDVQNFSKADKRALHGFSDAASYKSSTPYSEVNHAALKRMISESINDLPEKQRLVLSLYYYEDLNLKEIGRVLDVTESRVSQLHTQAILRLKGKLRNHWDEFVALFGAGGL